MKKILMLVVVVMAAISSVNAQKMYLGGGISLWRDDDADNTSFSISPEIGYNLSDKWAVGGQLIYAHAHQDEGLKVNSFAIAPYARFTYYQNKVVDLFLDMGLGISSTKVKHQDSETGFEIGIKPGIAINLNNQFSIVAKVGFAGYRDDYYISSPSNGFGVGVDSQNISFGLFYKF
ncbi:outer membrane beta-barrel protein [uncultured Bacteroides sp.]|uniref:outer membrane beta-barrel protein n=1 Tax=uncultured Bacteroides sp. TaxID=162156 RepID=UPI002606E51B|nr:outer membrane beta-barrel protein [uncultured Bacteroides sp.]